MILDLNVHINVLFGLINHRTVPNDPLSVHLPTGLDKGAKPPPPPPASEPRTPSDEERNQSVKLEIQGMNVSQVETL